MARRFTPAGHQETPMPTERIGERRGPAPPPSDAGWPLGLGLGLLVFFLRKLEEARVGEVSDFRKHQ